MLQKLPLFIYFLITWMFTLIGHSKSLNVDGVALLTFKKKLKTDPLNSLGDWNISDDTPCSWSGVLCANVPPYNGPRVVGLSVIGKKISGPIAPALGALDTLRRLSLQDNNLTGTLPTQLFNATSLRTILLGNNNITGHLPHEIKNLESLQTLDISNNRLWGAIPHTITNCKRLQTLALAHNQLWGSIPIGFGTNFTYLEQLDLSSNHLSGTIPSDLGQLPSLQGTLNLSYNHLSGSIPSGLGKLPYIVSLDLSHNNLSGEIPQDGTLGDQGASPFLGNPGLCGFPLDVICHGPLMAPAPLPNLPAEGSTTMVRKPKSGGVAHQAKNKASLSPGAIVGIVFGDALALSMILVLLMYWYYVKAQAQKKTPPSSSSTDALPGGGSTKAESKRRLYYSSRRCFSAHSEVSSEASGSPDAYSKGLTHHDTGGGGELVALDKSFSSDMDELLRASAYVLGKSELGIVYKVVLGSGNPVAVRRLGPEGHIDDDHLIHMNMKEFEGEVQAIAKLSKHPNVVKLLAYYWAMDEKLLIYDFIPHGSLASALHGYYPKLHATIPKLTWVQRLKIMEGAARGLAHIHDNTHISGNLMKGQMLHLHGDIKSSNILLGKDMQAYIADFGICQLTAWMNNTFDSSGQREDESRLKKSTVRPVGIRRSFYRPPEAASIEAGNGVARGLKDATQKWDVYAFGVVLMEVLTGKSPDAQMASAGIELVPWVRSTMEDLRSVNHVLDPNILGAPSACDLTIPPVGTVLPESVSSMLELAMSCTSPVPDRRPRMKYVVDAIQKASLSASRSI